MEVYVKSLVLARMKEKGVAEPDMKPTDIDLEKDYMSSESRFVCGKSAFCIFPDNCSPSLRTHAPPIAESNQNLI